MDPQERFCPNADCPARGQIGKGNIRVHSQRETRYRCRVCGHTFSGRDGTVFSCLHTHPNAVILVLTLLAHGCPVSAITAAFGFQERTVRDWIEKAGRHCETVHEALVQQPRDLGQIQADEIRVKTQRGIVWVAMALSVPSRIWLGAVTEASRSKGLIRSMLEKVRSCALECPLLVAVDGLSTYIDAIRRVFRTPVRTGHRGAPRKEPWAGLVIGQVIKRYEKRRVVEVDRRLVSGTEEQAAQLIVQTQRAGVLNTAFIERLNATFRARLFCLVRRTRSLARGIPLLSSGVYLVGTIYNFCTPHDSLPPNDLQTGTKTHRTPAMAAGITDHVWTVAELLWRRTPPPPWQPPRQRGRKSKQLLAIVQRWAS